MEPTILMIWIPALIALIDFIGFLIKGRQIVHVILLRLTEIGAFLILPWLYVSMDTENNCCTDSAVFSPDHVLSVSVLVVLCLIAYFYSSFRKTIATPVVEILVNGLLLIGILLNIFIAIHTNEIILAVGGNMPIILLAILVLVKNQRLFMEYSRHLGPSERGKPGSIVWRILHLQPILKFPVIFILCLPILVIISALLLLFGQKPDSLIRAFTDTYKHGFSQWDYQCENVTCDGHYLCSVAAKGHAKVVRPQRRGIRNGTTIICNRQLLISNAFEDLLQERMPFLHRKIRTQYNKVGNFVHRYYSIFNNRFVCDLIYVFMKPLEWFFLFTLYVFDRKPENRIAKQYISRTDREQIDNIERSM